MANGIIEAVFGAAGGTIAANGKLSQENKWRISAAWLAVVENSPVNTWQAYAGNKPIYEIIVKSKSYSERYSGMIAPEVEVHFLFARHGLVHNRDRGTIDLYDWNVPIINALKYLLPSYCEHAVAFG